MALTHEHYKAQGDLSPLAAQLLRTGKIVLITFFVLVCTRSVSDDNAVITTATLRLEGNQLVRSRLPSASDPAWPSLAPLYAVWPDKVLYLDSSLAIKHAMRFQTNDLVSSDRWGYAIYKKTGTEVDLFTPTGEKIISHSATAWPRAIGSANWILLYTGDQSGLAFLDRKTGAQVGPYQQLASLVTSAAVIDREHTAVFGMIDGSLEKFSIKEGKTAWRVQTPEGRLHAVKGLAIDQAEESILVVSGSMPETATRYSTTGKILWKTETGGDLRTQVGVHAGRHHGASQTARGLVIYDLGSGKIRKRLEPKLPSGARVAWTSFAESETGDVYASVSAGNYSAAYRFDKELKLRDLVILQTPWAEISLADKSSHTLALASTHGIAVTRRMESAP